MGIGVRNARHLSCANGCLFDRQPKAASPPGKSSCVGTDECSYAIVTYTLAMDVRFADPPANRGGRIPPSQLMFVYFPNRAD